MRRVVLLAAALLAVSAGPAAGVRSPVNEGGDARRCITQTEWDAVGLNMTRGRVERIVDSAGRRVNPDRMGVADQLAGAGGLEAQHPRDREVRLWHVCDQPHHSYYFALVEFKSNHVNPRFDRVQATYLSSGG